MEQGKFCRAAVLEVRRGHFRRVTYIVVSANGDEFTFV